MPVGPAHTRCSTQSTPTPRRGSSCLKRIKMSARAHVCRKRWVACNTVFECVTSKHIVKRNCLFQSNCECIESVVHIPFGITTNPRWITPSTKKFIASISGTVRQLDMFKFAEPVFRNATCFSHFNPQKIHDVPLMSSFAVMNRISCCARATMVLLTFSIVERPMAFYMQEWVNFLSWRHKYLLSHLYKQMHKTWIALTYNKQWQQHEKLTIFVTYFSHAPVDKVTGPFIFSHEINKAE